MFHKEQIKKYLIIVFLALIGAFLLILAEFFVPAVSDILKGSILFLLPFIVFSVLGMMLIFLTLEGKVRGKLRNFLLLTGISSAGFFISVFLHNVFYGLSVALNQTIALSYLMKFFDVSFFLIAILACPILFLISAISSIVLFLKTREI